MAVVLQHATLSVEQKELLRALLVLHPKIPPGPSMRYSDPKPPIVFYEKIGSDLRIPYAVGVTLQQTFVNHQRVNPQIPLNFTGNLLPHQEEVVGEALTHLRTEGTTTLGTYPGSGKTVMGAYLAAKVWKDSNQAETVLVLHPLSVLNESWARTFTEFTDARVWVVGVEEYPKTPPNVIVCLDQRITKVPKELLEAVGFLIIDEAHKFCTPSRVHALLATQPKYIVAETATLERPDDGMHVMIHALVGTHSINRISSKPFTVTKLLTGVEVPLTTGSKGVNYQALTTALCEHQQRNMLILDLIQYYLQQGWKIIVLTSRKEHVALLCKKLQEAQIRCDYMMGTKTSYQDTDVLLGTVSKIGTGFDEKMACPDFGGRRADLLLYLASTKKEGLMEQNVGRVFRAEKPAVIHLVDNNPISKRHWNVARKWYLSRGGVIQEAHAHLR